jgi:hypothetical protein
MSRQGGGGNEWRDVKGLEGDICDMLDIGLYPLFISRLMHAALNVTNYPIHQLKFDLYRVLISP